MTPKERFQRAVRFQKPEDYVSFMELEFQITEEYVGKQLVLGEEFAGLSAKEKERAHHENAQAMIAVMEKAGHDAVKEMGGYWEAAPGHPAFMWLPSMEDRLDYVRIFKQEAGERYFLLGNVGATMSIPSGDQLYDYVEKLFDEPQLIHEESESLLHQGLSDGVKLIDAGCDGIINASDIAFNTGTFISGEMLEEFFFPYFDRWVEETKRRGALTVWHTDGNINKVLPRAVAAGVEAIQCIDPLGGMDIVALKKEWYGKTALIGNLDCSLLQTGAREEVEAAAKAVLEGCKGDGGFVLSCCNAVFKGITGERYQWLVDSRYRFGKEEAC